MQTKNWLCKLIGHQYDPNAAEYYGMMYCERCMYEETHEDPCWLERIRWKFRLWREDRWHRFVCWYRCRDCGGWFGEHDESVEHIPF